MAERKKNTKNTSSKSKSSRKPTAKELEKMQAQFDEKRRFWSYILFFFGVFEVLVTFLEGDGLWKAMYRFNRGMFGLSVFVFGLFIIYMAVSIAGKKSKNAVIARALQGGIMFLLLSGAAQIFFGGEIEGANFFLKLRGLFLDGIALKGGGLTGAILGWTMLALFGKLGARIIIVMLIALFALLLSDLTLPQILRAIARPFVTGLHALIEDKTERTLERGYDERDTPVNRKNDPDFKDYPEIHRRTKSAPEPEETPTENRRKKKKRFIDFAEVQKAQLDMIKREEEAAKARAEAFNDPKEPSAITDDEEPEIWQPDMEISDILDNGSDEIISEQPLDNEPAPSNKPKKKKSDKPPTRAEIVEEEKNKLTEQIALDELIKKAASESNKEITLASAVDGGQAVSNTEYVYPPVELLQKNDRHNSEEEIQREIQDKSARLVETLETFGVKTRIIGIHRGPAVTRYELQPAAGVKVRQVTNLADDIALNLAADSIRMEAPIPGKPAIGIEIPNLHRDSVSMRELIDSDDYRRAKGKLSFAVGKDIEGNIVIGNIADMPHMLIAGTTGSGKSVFTNSIILNILFHASPDEVKMILIDPKKVEFPMYNGIPHLLIPVVTEPLRAAGALGWAVNEMMKRYKLFEANGTKNLEDYNEMVEEMLESDPDCGRTKLPQIVIVVDEFADLMLAAKNEVEESVMRLAQLARAAGMHMLIATQSPRVDVITGLIKANIPSRTALMVSNMKDSMVILDKAGAEKLLGRGDMLYQPVGCPKPMRIQSGFASTAEIRKIVDFLKNEHGANYDQEIVHEVEQNMPKPKNESDSEISINPDDDLVNQAITIIVETGNASTAFLQRKLKLGFPRAARIMDDIEAMGLIGPQEGAKPRKILITKEEWYERQGR